VDRRKNAGRDRQGDGKIKNAARDGAMVRTGKLNGIALALAICIAATAHAQTDETAVTPEDADITTEAEMEPMVDEPADLTIPLSPSAPSFDASKFMRGMPPPVWTGKAGIDNREGTPNAEIRPGHGLPGTMPEQTVGVAWANVTAPGLMAWDKTAIETRLDPYQQSRFGVILSRSVPVGGDMALTFQNAFAWTQPLLQSAPIVAHGSNTHVVEGSHAVRFTFLPADMTLSIGATGSSAEDGWRRSLSAEQRLFGGPVSITGAVSETATGELDRSLKAGFKRNW
jgi:hypothetical protein